VKLSEESSSPHVSSIVLKTKFIEIIKMFINQFVDESLQKTSYTINVLHENNVWIGLCPFCKNKKFKLQVERGSKCNATSLKAHFRKIHPKKNRRDS